MLESFDASKDQEAPVGNGTSITDLVIHDLVVRREAGKIKYGDELRTHNGRKALIDLYQELLDACLYCRQMIEES